MIYELSCSTSEISRQRVCSRPKDAEDPTHAEILRKQVLMLFHGQQGRVYKSERRLRALFDEVEQSGNPVVEVNRTPLTLPTEFTFDSINEVQDYVNGVSAVGDVVKVFGELPAPRVRARRGRYGVRRAVYLRGEEPVIAIPNGVNRWAMRELVVLARVGPSLRPGALHGARTCLRHGISTLLRVVMGEDTVTAAEVFFAQGYVIDELVPYFVACAPRRGHLGGRGSVPST